MSIQGVSSFNGMTASNSMKSSKNVAFGSIKIVPDNSFIEYKNSIYLGTPKQKLENGLFLFKSKLSQMKEDGVLILRKMPEEVAKNNKSNEDIQLEFNGKTMGFFTDIFNDQKPLFNEGFNLADNLMTTFRSIA